MRKAILFIIVGLILLGCSGKGGNNPIAPPAPPVPPTPPSAEGIDISLQETTEGVGNRRYLLGFWDIVVSEDRQSAQVVPKRVSEMHLNAVRLLQEEPCEDCIEIRDIRYVAPDEIRVLLRI